jgi:23S rRNA (guanosine2251-2'-O)-methyltransferase
MAGGASHQGIVARIARVRFQELDEVMAGIEERGSLPLLVALDQIVDPHNLGAIARTADAAGADALLVPRHKSAVPSGAAFKASAGALSRIPLCRVTNLARALGDLKKSGVWVVGTSADEGQPPWELDLSGSLVVVIGSEEKGMRPGVRAACDFMTRIPIAGMTGSLNASVAAGMVLYEIVRGRPPGAD